MVAGTPPPLLDQSAYSAVGTTTNETRPGSPDVQAPPIPEQPERPRRGRPPTREGSEAPWVRERRTSALADDWIPAAARYEAWEARDPEVRAM